MERGGRHGGHLRARSLQARRQPDDCPERREKINQLGSQIVGAEAQVQAYTDEITSVKTETKEHRANED